MVTAVVASHRFGALCPFGSRFSLSVAFCSSALRSSRLSPGFITTMASADFPGPLSLGISLGQCWGFPFVPSGSTAAVDDSWASLVFACSPAVGQPLCRFVFLQSKVRLRPFRTGPLRFRSGLRLRLSSSTPSGTFHPDSSSTCQAHERRLSSRRRGNSSDQFQTLNAVHTDSPATAGLNSNEGPSFHPDTN